MFSNKNSEQPVKRGRSRYGSQIVPPSSAFANTRYCFPARPRKNAPKIKSPVMVDSDEDDDEDAELDYNENTSDIDPVENDSG